MSLDSPKVAYVEWLDASGFTGTMDLDDVTDDQWDLRMQTAGLLLEDSEEKVIIAQDVWKPMRTGKDQTRCIEVIPRAYITKMEVWGLEDTTHTTPKVVPTYRAPTPEEVHNMKEYLRNHAPLPDGFSEGG